MKRPITIDCLVEEEGALTVTLETVQTAISQMVGSLSRYSSDNDLEDAVLIIMELTHLASKTVILADKLGRRHVEWPTLDI